MTRPKSFLIRGSSFENFCCDPSPIPSLCRFISTVRELSGRECTFRILLKFCNSPFREKPVERAIIPTDPKPRTWHKHVIGPFSRGISHTTKKISQHFPLKPVVSRILIRHGIFRTYRLRESITRSNRLIINFRNYWITQVLALGPRGWWNIEEKKNYCRKRMK